MTRPSAAPEVTPKGLKIFLRAADALFRVGRVDRALELAEAAAGLETADVDLKFNIALLIGNCYADQRNHASAKLVYEEALQKWPRAKERTRAWAHHNLGSLSFTTGRYEEGRRAYGEAARLRAESGQPLEPTKTLAHTAQRVEQYNPFAALVEYDAARATAPPVDAASIDPSLARLLGAIEFARGRLLFDEIDDPERALAAFTVALRLLKPILQEERTVASLLVWMAHCHVRLGDHDAAAALGRERAGHIADSLELDTARIDAVLRGEAPADGSLQEKGVANYANALRLADSNLPKALVHLEEAIRLDEAARASDPGLQTLLLAFGASLLWRADQVDDAIAWLRRATAMCPGFTRVRLTLVAFLFAAGRYGESSSAARALATDFPAIAQAHFYAGMSAYRLADYAQAIASLEKARTLGAPHVDAVLTDVLTSFKKRTEMSAPAAA